VELPQIGVASLSTRHFQLHMIQPMDNLVKRSDSAIFSQGAAGEAC
jgi:hypothetical protein